MFKELFFFKASSTIFSVFLGFITSEIFKKYSSKSPNCFIIHLGSEDQQNLSRFWRFLYFINIFIFVFDISFRESCVYNFEFLKNTNCMLV